jgi:hypothetical protein
VLGHCGSPAAQGGGYGQGDPAGNRAHGNSFRGGLKNKKAAGFEAAAFAEVDLKLV